VSYDYITTHTALEKTCAAFRTLLEHDPRLAVDTEFVTERTYAPVLELVQIASADGRVALIDVQALGDEIDALAPIVLDDNVLKLVHAGNQDLSILRAYLGAAPGNVFDTQIAASYLGHPLQLGYGQMVRTLLRVTLEKGESYSDWTRRPLTQSMLDYAADDVRHLHAIHTKLESQLEKLGRADWVAEACASMVFAADNAIPVRELWRQFSGRTSLDRRGLAVLRELCVWRDEEAQRRNKPRRSVVKDDLLLEVARRQPSDPTAILQLRSAPPSLGERAAREIVERVKIGRAVPHDEQPEAESSVSLDDQASALHELLSAVVRVRAIEAEIAPSLLASSEALRQIAAARAEVPGMAVFQGWRDRIVGDALRGALAGRVSVAWDTAAGRLILK
jgi:ribonuclease D